MGQKSSVRFVAPRQCACAFPGKSVVSVSSYSEAEARRARASVALSLSVPIVLGSLAGLGNIEGRPRGENVFLEAADREACLACEHQRVREKDDVQTDDNLMTRNRPSATSGNRKWRGRRPRPVCENHSQQVSPPTEKKAKKNNKKSFRLEHCVRVLCVILLCVVGCALRHTTPPSPTSLLPTVTSRPAPPHCSWEISVTSMCS